MNKPLFDRPIAHRGFHDRVAGIIENSASAFERAIAHNYAIECDLQVTRDGEIVVFHDDKLERLTGLSGPIREIDSKTLCQTPLRDSAAGDCPQLFTDFLAQIAGRTLLQIELKRQMGAATETLASKAAAIISGYKGPVVFESFDPELIIFIRNFGFQGKRGIITYAYDKPEWEDGLDADQCAYLRDLKHAPETRFDFISCNHTDVTLPAVREWRAKGVPVAAWTIHSVAEANAAAPDIDQIVFEGFDPDRA